MSKCNCTMTQKLVGDGCENCNPALVIDMLELNIQDLEHENEQLQLENQKLRDLVGAAPKYFSPEHDFDGKKLEWILNAGNALNGETK